jgi:peptidoglycan hydrolase-like protein with peptidoglycan-binding domain
LYDGEFHGKYDPKTIEAVYKFQLQEGVITWKETNKSAYGWMWPATRAKLNKKMNP